MKYLTTGKAGKRLGVAKTTVYRWCEQGRVPNAFYLDGIGWVIPESALGKIDRPRMGGASHKSYKPKKAQTGSLVNFPQLV